MWKAYQLELLKCDSKEKNYEIELLFNLEKNENINSATYILNSKENNYCREVLKISRFINMNTLYEFEAGLFVNTYLTRLPCFTKTTGLYKFDSHEHKEENLMNKKKLLDRIKLVSTLESYINKVDCNDFCKNCDMYCIKTEYVTGETFEKFFKSIEATKKNVEITICILYMIYMQLDLLKNQFTHNDLHSANIVLYKLNSPIHCEYHINQKNSLYFYTKYIPKIIDYGKSSFENNTYIWNKLNACQAQKKCSTAISNYGLHFCKKYEKVYLCSNKFNHTRDLMLLHDLQKTNKKIFDMIFEGKTVFHDKGKLPPTKSDWFSSSNIKNVYDAHVFFQKLLLLKSSDYKKRNDNISSTTLHVYYDLKTPMNLSL